jgi:signal transduction histidine kinase
VREAVAAARPAEALAAVAAGVEERADLEYLLEHTPRALDACRDGLDRVGAIVRSLKEFAHPQRDIMAAVDFNDVVSGTLTLARNEYKYIADLETDLGALPPVTCVAGAVSQLLLNLVVNSAHAVADAVRGTGAKGAIRVSTRGDGDHVVLTVADTGTGIPEHVRPHIFERFFTTKAVGKGTGQGLSLVKSVVEQHGGTIVVEGAEGTGATFIVRLPIAGRGAGAGRSAEAA